MWRSPRNWKHLNCFRKVKVKIWKSSYASVGSWQWKCKEVPIAIEMKSSEISNENVSCGHTEDGQHGSACQYPAAAVGRSGGSWTWSSPFLACRWPPLESHFVNLHHPSFFSCLAIIKNFGPSRSKHTTKLMNPILILWLARDHWHWEVFFTNATNVFTNALLWTTWGLTKMFSYKCIQCNYKCIFVGRLRNHKSVFTNATIVTMNALLKEAWGLTTNVKRATCEKMLSFSCTSWWIIREIHM